jgi:ABC-type dipeptide/oligopeptide/nickel transport system permease subunit
VTDQVLANARPATPNRSLQFMRRLLRARLAPVACAITVALVCAALFAPLIAPYAPDAADGYHTMEGPSWLHWLGTDELGRDVLSRAIHGSRVTLIVGLSSVIISVVLGVPLGLVAGYFGGRTDHIIMRLMDALYAFPPLLLALALVAVLGPSVINVIVAVGVIMTPTFSRLARAQALSARSYVYVTAAKTLGASSLRILTRHIWPNVTAAIIVQSSIGMAWAILSESALSYLGVGVRPPIATWGVMLSEAFRNLEIDPLLSIIPGAAIFLTVLSLNILGDALRDALDPRLKYLN